MTIHFLHHGMTACMRQGPPGDWPEGHKWSGDWKDVNCDDCLLGRGQIKTYVISADGRAITCLRCKMTSYSPDDVAHRYCAKCCAMHDDIWPPARMWWLKSYGKETKENVHPKGNPQGQEGS